MQRRPLVTVCAALVAGIFLSRYAALPWWALAVCAVGFVGVFSATGQKGPRILSYTSLYALVAVAGALWYQARQMHVWMWPLEPTPESAPLLLRGTIVSPVRLETTTPVIQAAMDERPLELSLFDLRVDSLALDSGTWQGTDFRVQASVQGFAHHVRHGDRVEVLAAIHPLRPPRNPGAFDYSRYASERGIAGTARILAPESMRVIGRTSVGIAGLMELIRSHLRQYVASRVPKNGAGLVNALVLGSRGSLTRDWADVFARSGTMHFLAVSGLHVGLVGALGWICGRRLRLDFRRAGIITLAIVVVYAALVGFRPSVLRATLMAVAFLIGLIAARQRDALNLLALAAILVLVARPQDLFDGGFEMSFAAAGFLVLFFPELARWARREPDRLQRLSIEAQPSILRLAAIRLRRYAVMAAIVSLVAWLGAAPLVWKTFRLITPVSVVASVLVAPLIWVLLSGGLVLLAAGWIPGVGALLGYGVWVPAWLLQRVVSGLAAAPLGHFYAPEPATGWVVAYYALAAVIAARRALSLRAMHIFGMAMLFVAAFIGSEAFHLSRARPFSFTVLDVGHGLSVFLEFPDRTNLLYDAGSVDESVGRNDIGPFMWSQGVRRIDALVLSHPDADHVNAVPDLVKRFRVGKVFVNEGFGLSSLGQELLKILARDGLKHAELNAGDVLTLGAARVITLNPPSGAPPRSAERQNDASLVIMVECGERTVLLCGDIERAGATQIVAHLPRRPDIDALILPHHGAHFQGAAGFAQRVRAEAAIASCGWSGVNNMVRSSFESAGTPVFSTEFRGALRGRWISNELLIEQWSAQEGRWKEIHRTATGRTEQARSRPASVLQRRPAASLVATS